MLLYRKKYSSEKRDEQENKERKKRAAREVGLLRAELSSSVQKIEALESALKKSEDTESGTSNQAVEAKGRPLKRRRLKHLQEWSIEDWDQLLEFDREYGLFSPMDKQRIGNIYSKLEMGLTVKMSVLSEGEQCYRKAINNGYKLYTLERDRWEELLTAAAEDKLLPQWDLEFLEELAGKLMAGEISSKFDMVKGKDLLNIIEERLK
jgi:hypothetical protein